jgi:hypothetical protein
MSQGHRSVQTHASVAQTPLPRAKAKNGRGSVTRTLVLMGGPQAHEELSYGRRIAYSTLLRRRITITPRNTTATSAQMTRNTVGSISLSLYA